MTLNKKRKLVKLLIMGWLFLASSVFRVQLVSFRVPSVLCGARRVWTKKEVTSSKKAWLWTVLTTLATQNRPPVLEAPSWELNVTLNELRFNAVLWNKELMTRNAGKFIDHLSSISYHLSVIMSEVQLNFRIHHRTVKKDICWNPWNGTILHHIEIIYLLSGEDIEFAMKKLVYNISTI